MRLAALILILLAACDGAVSPAPSGSTTDGDPQNDDPSEPGTVGDGGGDNGSASDDEDSSPCCRPDAFSTVYAGRFMPVDPSDLTRGNTFEPFGLVPAGNDRFELDTCGTYTAATDALPHRFNASGCCPTGFSVHDASTPGTNEGPSPYQFLTVTCIRSGEACPAGCPQYQETLPRPGWRWEATGPTTFEWRRVSTCVTVVLDDDGNVVEADASGCCPGGRVASVNAATPTNPTITCYD